MPGSNAQSLVAGLVASHGLQLRRFLLARVRNVADVPDFIQEVYLRMLRVPNAESIRSPEAYLFTVAQHVVQQQALQSGTPTQLMRMLEPSQSGHEANPEQDASAQQCLEQLQRALEGLHPKARAAFILSRRDGLNFDEIAERLGVSRPMAKKYLTKALMRFRQSLAEQD
ncbi:MAG TPA: sigma-70 family RNA polymerase sigma factor [Steroidobacter sp.]